MLYSYDVDGMCTNYPRQLSDWIFEIDQEVNEYQKNVGS